MFRKRAFKNMAIMVVLVFVLVPIGLIAEGPAWGEWDSNYFKNLLGFVPEGIEKSKQFNPVFADYKFGDLGSITSYYLSAFVGVVIIFLSFYMLKVLMKNER